MSNKLDLSTTVRRISRMMGTWIFLLLTLLALYQGEVTIFYIIYFFWWSELLRIIAVSIINKRNSLDADTTSKPILLISSLFMMGIYFVFIIVIFGFMANWGNDNMMIVNFQIMLFQNWFFNLNLLVVLVELVTSSRAKNNDILQKGVFSSSMLVLHISIILGATMMFFIVKRFPETFNPKNSWGSFIIIFPFLLLRILFQGYGKNTGDTPQVVEKPNENGL